VLVIRPERLELLPASAEAATDGESNIVRGTVKSVTYLGALVKYVIQAGPAALIARAEAPDEGGMWKAGDDVVVRWRVTDSVLVSETGEAEGSKLQEDAR
jgi:putative spermidine/putrescine transport system ATP-binding protein